MFLWATSVYLNCLCNPGCLSVYIILKEWLKQRKINSLLRDICYLKQMGSNCPLIKKYTGEICHYWHLGGDVTDQTNPKSHSSYNTTRMDISGSIYTNTQTHLHCQWLISKYQRTEKKMNQTDGEHRLARDALYYIYS